ncbi:MAG: copper amine oxidase N-terminal domain-containing protein [Clostridia bacterium]|nr:copper amine oxidase N-terminal domain-containing protein [Clostridia bacterium]
MRKILCAIIAMLMIVSMICIVSANDETVVYLSTSTGSNDNDGLTPQTPKKSYEKLGGKGVMGLLESGGTLVVVGKSYLGGDYAMPRMRGPLTITSVWDGVDYKNATPASNPACAFKLAGGATLSIQTEVTFDDIIIFQEGKLNNTIVVEDGGILTITESVICMTKQPDVYYNIVVERGGTAIINGGIYSSVTGDGDITIGGSAKIHEKVEVDPNAPDDGDLLAVFHNSNANDQNDGLTPSTPKKSLGSLTSGLVSLIPRGGTIVTVGKSYIGSNFTFPITSGPVTFTSVWNGVDYKNPEPATNPSCAFKMASGATLTIASDLIFNDIILFQENNQNTIHVTAGATLIVNDNVVFMTKPGNEYHYRVIVDEGCTAMLSDEAIKTFDLYGAGEVINTTTGEMVDLKEYVAPVEGVTEVRLTIGSKNGYINGVARPLDAAPIIKNNRTMLPVRFLANAFGVENDGIKWDAATRTATLTNDSVTIVVTIDAPTMTVNGNTVELDSPAIIENDRTYLPVRAIANALGVENDNIKWDGATSTATLVK